MSTAIIALYIDAERHGRQKMKAFKKWWHNISVDELNKSGFATAAWRAALEWVKEIKEENSILDKYDILVIIEEEIEKELNAKT